MSETEFYKDLFDQSPIAMAIFGTDGCLLHINAASIRLWNVGMDWVRSGEFRKFNIFTDETSRKVGLLSYFERGLAGEACSTPPILYDRSFENDPQRKTVVMTTFIYPVKDSRGKVRELITLVMDVSDQYQSEKALKLLAESAELMETSLDYRTTLDRIARLATRWVGGWCEIFVRGEAGDLRREAFHHHDDSKLAALARLREVCPAKLEVPHGPGAVIRTGQPELIRKAARELLDGIPVGHAGRSLLEEIGMDTWIGVPLRNRGAVTGALCVSAGARSYNEQDLALIQELANRASVALQNAELYGEAQRAIGMRDEFLSIASHELRTPLTSLSLQIESLLVMTERGSLASQSGERMLAMFQSSLNQLNGLSALIDNLLDTTRLRESKVRLKLERIELKSIVESALERLAYQFERSHCRIEADLKGPIHGVWDRLRIEQVISNLLTNALKYGACKPIIVRTWIESGEARFSVQDFGIGIAREDQKKIFERFERATSVQSFGGLGLGLYISHQIVQLHHGRISVESAPEAGSTFTVALPTDLTR